MRRGAVREQKELVQKMIALFVFWASVVTILFVYLAYPLLIWLVAEISPKETRKATVTPSVSILIAAYDEEASIAKTLDNKLALDYPRLKLHGSRPLFFLAVVAARGV